MSSPIGPFCESCAAIDLKSLLYQINDPDGEKGGTDDIRLGTLESIIQRSDGCELCNLVFEALRERYRRTPPKEMSDFKSSCLSSEDELCGDGDGDGDVEKERARKLTKSDEIEKYGIPITWESQDIQCHLTPRFFCHQTNVLDYTKIAESPGRKTEETNVEEKGVLLRIHRLLVTLSPSPWLTFTWSDGVKLHATWEDEETNDETKNEIPAISPAGSGRRVSPFINVSRIRGWLHQCEEGHGKTCSETNRAVDNLDQWKRLTFRVMDVKERRVVDLPGQGRYVALSYVWGRKEAEPVIRTESCLTTKNQSQLRELNGLDRLSLPQTILDAMSLTLELGERYLWVDALCILQDDMNDLNVQTSCMDVVYSKSILTILAACGDNANFGLTGMPGRPRNIFHRSIKISSDGLCISPVAALSSQDFLERSNWNQRGWTFQERLLSRCILAFTNSQIYWKCTKSMWDEETIFEPIEPRVWILSQELKINDDWDENEPRFSKAALDTYMSQFSSRELTFASDALAAFLGIIRRVEYLYQEELFWGITTTMFDQDLLWRYGKSRRKEMQPIVVNGSTVHHVPYPSWSWLGWKGSISGNPYNRDLAKRRWENGPNSEIIFYSLMSDGTVRLLHGAKASEDQLPQSKAPSMTQNDENETAPPPTWKGDGIITGPIKITNKETIFNPNDVASLAKRLLNLDLNVPVHDTGRLVFQTSYVKAQGWLATKAFDRLFLKVGNRTLQVKGTFQQNLVVYMRIRVLPDSTGDSEPPSDDDIWTYSSDESSHSHGEPVDPQCLVVGRKSTLNMIFISRFYELFEPQETGKLNVMIVKESRHQAGVWSRVGLAVIEEKDWAQFESTWETIILE